MRSDQQREMALCTLRHGSTLSSMNGDLIAGRSTEFRMRSPDFGGHLTFRHYHPRDDFQAALFLWPDPPSIENPKAVTLRAGLSFEVILMLQSSNRAIPGLKPQHIPDLYLMTAVCWLRLHGTALMDAGKALPDLKLPNLGKDQDGGRSLVFTSYDIEFIRRTAEVRADRLVCRDAALMGEVEESMAAALETAPSTLEELLRAVPWPSVLVEQTRIRLERSGAIVSGRDELLSLSQEYALMKKRGQVQPVVSIGTVQGPVHTGTGDIHLTQITVHQALTAIAEKAEASAKPEEQSWGKKLRDTLKEIGTDIAAKTLAEVVKPGG